MRVCNPKIHLFCVTVLIRYLLFLVRMCIYRISNMQPRVDHPIDVNVIKERIQLLFQAGAIVKVAADFFQHSAQQIR